MCTCRLYLHTVLYMKTNTIDQKENVPLGPKFQAGYHVTSTDAPILSRDQ